MIIMIMIMIMIMIIIQEMKFSNKWSPRIGLE